MGEGEAAIGDGDADRLVAEVEPGERAAAVEQRRQVFDVDRSPSAAFPLT